MRLPAINRAPAVESRTTGMSPTVVSEIPDKPPTRPVAGFTADSAPPGRVAGTGATALPFLSFGHPTGSPSGPKDSDHNLSEPGATANALPDVEMTAMALGLTVSNGGEVAGSSPESTCAVPAHHFPVAGAMTLSRPAP